MSGTIGGVQTLSKGANVPLPPGPVSVRVVAGGAVDVSALLLTSARRVRGDDDFVFYHQPQAPGVRLGGAGGVEVDPAALDPAIEAVVVTASLDGSGPATFGALGGAGGFRVDVAVAGRPAVTFAPDGLGPETALLCVELYRRAGAWKVRAVGQGYAQGLAGIATDFGITVADEPETPAPPPVRLEKTLDAGRVSLRKRETVSLTKGGRPALRRVAMGLGWDPASGGGEIDLDASAVVIGRTGKKVDSAWFMSLRAVGGAVAHSGDNLTGEGAGDDETITVDLDGLPADVAAIVFVVTSFRGQRFTEVRNAYCRLVDRDSGAELVRFDLSDSEARTGVVMSVLHRGPRAWEMTAVGEFHDGRNARAMYRPAEQVVAGLAG